MLSQPSLLFSIKGQCSGLKDHRQRPPTSLNFTADFERKNQGRVGETVCICSDGGGVRGQCDKTNSSSLAEHSGNTSLCYTDPPKWLRRRNFSKLRRSIRIKSRLPNRLFLSHPRGPRPTVPARRRQSEDVSKQKKDRKREQFIQKRPNREITHSSFIFCFISLSAARLLYACLVWVIPTGRGNVFQKHLN